MNPAEPGSSFASVTRVKTLTRQTREDNARFFDSVDEVPVHCITQGLGTILRAKRLVLLAFGAGKARAVAAATTATPSPRSPPGTPSSSDRPVDGYRKMMVRAPSRSTRSSANHFTAVVRVRLSSS